MAGPPPPPWDPYYAQWYSQWYYSQYPGYPAPPSGYAVQPTGFTGPPPGFTAPPPAFTGPPPVVTGPSPTKVTAPPPPPPPAEVEPPPPVPGQEDEAPPAKRICATEDELKIRPEWQAAKKGAVIYKNPRPPTPEPPKPAQPAQPAVLPPPKLVEPADSTEATLNKYLTEEPKKKVFQWFYDGQSWVYASEQPEMKPPKEPEEKYTFGGAEDPVQAAVMANIRGSWSNNAGKRGAPDKPKATPVRCEVCSLTVSCEKTYASHINGKPHKKRLAQVERMKQLEEKVKADTERAANSLPGGNVPNNPLTALPNGDIKCTVCEVTMNGGAQAQSHLGGVKHKTRMDKAVRASWRGRGGWRGGLRGGWHSSRETPPQQMMYPGNNQTSAPAPAPAPVAVMEDGASCTTEEAEEEYERVFADNLSNNVDVEEAKRRAEEAKQAALAVFKPQRQTEGASSNTSMENFAAGNAEGFPPPGVTILAVPVGGQPGNYRCDLCSVVLGSESVLEAHLVSPDHVAKAKGGKVYRGRPNAAGEGTMKAQRGRRGLISAGEIRPDKLTKGQKKAQPKDIAALLAQKGAEQGEGTGSARFAPLLMSFVPGGVMEGDR